MKNPIPRAEFFVQSIFLQQRLCPHCQARESVTLARKYMFIEIRKCQQCLLQFTSPIYKSFFSKEFYDRFYTEDSLTTTMPSLEQLEQLKQTGFRGCEKDFNPRLERLKQFLLPDGADAVKLLEIGSSWGYFLYQARQTGFDPTGVEVASQRRNYGIKQLGVSIVDSFAVLPAAYFDVIYTTHVLEHFTDLSQVFNQCNQHLRQAGKLIIEVPNFDFERFGAARLPTIGAVHPLGFSSEFFKKNLKAYGFAIQGFWDSWETFPDNPLPRSSGDSIILVAEKERSL
jgi:2-polyprenyl-3-methyl-5-hydroxy-6-metoxy-1,4-benzoquinol methylase